MATYSSRQVNKKKTERGTHALMERGVGGYFQIDRALTTSDVIRMVRLGEDQRITALRVWVRAKSGALALSTTSFTCGVAPVSASNFVRPDGTTFTPVTANATLYGTVALATDGFFQLTDTLPPPGNKGYAPYFITLTPSATITPTGTHELVLEVDVQGEADAGTLAYTSFP